MLIDDLTREIDRYTNPSDPEGLDGCYIDLLMVMDRRGMIIDGESVKDYLYEKVPGLVGLWPYVKSHIYTLAPPSENCWIEYNCQGIGRIGCLIKHGSFDERVLSHDSSQLPAWVKASGATYMMMLTPFGNTGGEPALLRCMGWVFMTDDWSLIPNDNGGYGLLGFPNEDEVPGELYADCMSEIASITLFTLSMLNIKNVVRRPHHPDKKLQIKRVKNGRRPLVTYYTLEVTVPGKHFVGGNMPVAKDEGENSRPLHLVRGHLADYRDGKGLFGKYKGVYWMPAHFRGKAENGVVNKRYKVDIAP